MTTPSLLLVGHYTTNQGVMGLTACIAVLGLYVTLDLACEVWSADDRVSTRLWMLAAAIALGTTLWAVNIVGMAAADFPVTASYDVSRIAVSWLIAVFVAAAPLSIAPRVRVSHRYLATVSLLTGVGLITVHGLGIFALRSEPVLHLQLTPLLAVVATSLAGSWVGLRLFLLFRARIGRLRLWLQALAALITGGFLTWVHFLAVSCIGFIGNVTAPAGHTLDVQVFGDVVAVAAIVFFLITAMMTALTRRAGERARRLHGSLSLAQDELKYVSLTDTTTGLPNRLVFQDRLRQAVARHARLSSAVAVLLVDLDGFKDSSHIWTPDLEAELLLVVAERLRETCRDCDTVTTAGHGQFLILLEGHDTGVDATRMAQTVLDAMRAPCYFGNKSQAVLTASIGISELSADRASDGLVSDASAAMMVAKHQGGNRFRFHEIRMDEEAHAAAEMLADLRQALQRAELHLVYQPKVFAESGALAGVEALVRWDRRGLGLVSPALFVPLAERYGLIDEIGAWVMERACQQIGAWRDAGHQVCVAVNISACQLRQQGLADAILANVDRHGVDPSLLTIEITETAAMVDTANALKTFDALNARGINISIDDFGTGYSSLSYLRRLPVREIKIDRSFVCDLETSDDARAIAQAIVHMAHALRLEVVAEGVETEAQQRILVSMECDKLQGFLFSKPVSPDAIAAIFTVTAIASSELTSAVCNDDNGAQHRKKERLDDAGCEPQLCNIGMAQLGERVIGSQINRGRLTIPREREWRRQHHDFDRLGTRPSRS